MQQSELEIEGQENTTDVKILDSTELKSVLQSDGDKGSSSTDLATDMRGKSFTSEVYMYTRI